MLFDCHSCVKWENVYSDFFTVIFGVRQGSVLAPFLFAVFLDELSDTCNLDHNRFIVRDRQEVKPRKVESQKRVVVRYSVARRWWGFIRAPCQQTRRRTGCSLTLVVVLYLRLMEISARNRCTMRESCVSSQWAAVLRAPAERGAALANWLRTAAPQIARGFLVDVISVACCASWAKKMCYCCFYNTGNFDTSGPISDCYVVNPPLLILRFCLFVCLSGTPV